MINKIKTYCGFALKSMKVKLGVNSIRTIKKAQLMLVCSTATENTFSDAVKLSKKLGCKLIKCMSVTVEELFNKVNLKVVAILDKSLAQAILDNLDEGFIVVGG